MVKKSLIAIALLAFLATTVQAGDLADNPRKFDDNWPWTYTALEICQIPVYMDVGYYVKLIDCHKKEILLKQVTCDKVGKDPVKDFPCYSGCVEFEMIANFEVKLSTKLYKDPIGIIDGWSAKIYLDDYVTEDYVIPGDGGKHKRVLCVDAWKAQIWKNSPSDKVKVGVVAILVKPNA